jgi:hypothetical protein
MNEMLEEIKISRSVKLQTKDGSRFELAKIEDIIPKHIDRERSDNKTEHHADTNSNNNSHDKYVDYHPDIVGFIRNNILYLNKNNLLVQRFFKNPYNGSETSARKINSLFLELMQISVSLHNSLRDYGVSTEEKDTILDNFKNEGLSPIDHVVSDNIKNILSSKEKIDNI